MITSPFKLSEITAMCLKTLSELNAFIKDRKPSPIVEDAIKEMGSLKHKAMHPQSVLDAMGWTKS